MDSKQTEDSSKPKRLTVDMVTDRFRLAENWTDIRQIMVNVNYYVGNQHIGWNRSERRIQALPAEAGVERVTRNKIRPRVTTLLAKHTKNKIKFNVIPGSREQSDVDTAKAADKFLQYQWQELDFTQKTRDIFLNCLIKKRCYVKTWFDASAGDEITPVEGDRGYDQWSQGDKKPVFTGVIRARVCDPLTIFTNNAVNEDDIKWYLERKATDCDEIFEEYGIRVTPDANIDYISAYDITRIGAEGLGQGEVKRLQNMAMLSELWVKPCKQYPKGAKITVAGGVELDYNDAAGELPYVLFGYIPIPGTILYDAIVTDMLAPQREINVLRSMVATHARRLGNAMWLNPIGSNVDEEDLINEIAGIVNYTPANNMKPERIQAPDIPSFYGQELANNAMDLDDMSGAREVSQGRLPSGLDTLGGLEIMVEQENEKLTVASQTYERGMKRVMQRILRLIKAHYTEERQGRILGEDNEIELISFKGSDLTGSEDINVVQGSSLPEMKAAQQERIMLMWKSNAIVKKDGTPDSNKLLRLMGMGDSTELFEEHALDENNAKMEDKTFEDMAENPQAMQVVQAYLQQYQFLQTEMQAAGAPPEVLAQTMPPFPPGIPDIWDSDDDEVHILIHNVFRKTSRYRKLDPALRKMVDLHYQKHVDRVNAPMLAQQQAEMEAAKVQQESSSKESEAARQHQTQMKGMDQTAKLQSDVMKTESAMATAAMKSNTP